MNIKELNELIECLENQNSLENNNIIIFYKKKRAELLKEISKKIKEILK